jgi:hypothetical protein
VKKRIERERQAERKREREREREREVNLKSNSFLSYSLPCLNTCLAFSGHPN